MFKKIIQLFSTVAFAALSFWFISGALAATEAVDIFLYLSSDVISLEDPSFNANIVVERTDETGTPPFTLEFLMPLGTSLDGSEEDIQMEGDNEAKLSLEGRLLTISSGDMGSGRFEAKIPLKFDGCPDDKPSCELEALLRLTDSKEETIETNATITAKNSTGPAEDDLDVKVTPLENDPNGFLIIMTYERSPGTGSDDMALGYTGIPFANISNLTVDLENAEGFKAEEGKDGNGFRAEGQIAEGGKVTLGFNIGMPPCANGASECAYTHQAIVADDDNNFINWGHELDYVEPADDAGEFNFIMNLIGAGQIGGTLLMDGEVELRRDGGSGSVEGEMLIIFPDDWALSSSVEEIKINTLKAVAGDPKINGQQLSIPLDMGPDSVTLVGFGTFFEDDCPNPECKFLLEVEWKPTEGDSFKASKELSFDGESPDSGSGDGIFIGCCGFQETVAAGESVPLEFGLFNPGATADEAGEYKFLLEVSGLVNTGKIEPQFTNAGPEKFFFDPEQQQLKWEGTIEEGGQIRVRALFEADVCSNGSSCSANAKLTILLPDGSKIEKSDSILIQDESGFDPDLVQYKAAVWSGDSDRPEALEEFDKLPFEAACMQECENFLIGIKNDNEEKAEVWVVVEAATSLKLGPPDGYKLQVLSEDKQAGTSKYGIRVLVGDELKVLGLTAQIDGLLEDDSQIPMEISFCAQPVGSERCTEELKNDDQREPDFIVFLLYFIYRVRDFGDAPNVENHFGALMESYGPGTALAHYPMGRDPSILAPPPNQIKGPAHRFPWQFHLGDGVTTEFAIDRNFDADGTNNIEPSIGIHENNFDGRDDGIDMSAIVFDAQCDEDVVIPVDVTISSSYITWFEANDDDDLAYINIWLDSDRDGRWDTGPGLCPQFGSNDHEHIVVDHGFDPVALGVGTHTISVTAPIVDWPQAFGLPDEPAWMRVMLTNIESNKDLYITHGDGRGEDFVYYAGETEDYYYVAPQATAGSESAFTADMTLDVELINPGTFSDKEVEEFVGKRGTDGEMVIRFRNDGYKTAEDIEVLAELPQTIIEFGSFSFLKCDGCDEEIEILEGLGSFKIDRLEPGEFGKITLGWKGCLTCVRSVDDSLAQAQISVKSKADFRPENNFKLFEAWPVKSRLTPQVTLGWNGCLTCVRSVDESLIPDAYNFLFETRDPDVSHYRMYYNGEQVGEDQEMCDGIPCKDLGFEAFDFVIANGGGLGLTTFTYVNKDGKESPHSKPIELTCTNDIVHGSLTFTNEATGQQRRVPAEKHITSPGDVPLVVMSGGSTMLATVMYCGDDPSPELSLKIGDQDFIFTQLKEGDVIYETSFLLEIDGRKPVSSIVLSVESNGTTYEDEFATEQPAQGTVSDAETGLPVTNAEILILVEQSTEFGGETVSVMAPWDGSATGQSNPVMVSSDGSYSAEVPNGTYQLVVLADGYQSYRSAVMEVEDGQIASMINLIEARPAPSNINIGVDSAGFEQSFVEVEAGWVVKFINTGTGMHGAASDEIGESSGLMAPGESFKMAFETVGTFAISDPANPNSTMTISVIDGSSGPSEPGDDGTTVYLPIIQR